MKVVIYAAKGKAGAEIVKELLSRGHEVTAVARKVDGLPGGVKAVSDDASHAQKVAEVVKGADVVVSAIAPPASNTDLLVKVTDVLIEGVALAGGKNGGPRLLVVGGAGSLLVPGPDGRKVTIRESGALPPEYIPIIDSHIKVLDNLRANNTINWTYFSPAAFLQVGPRKGSFRLGQDDLIVGENGQSEISYADYAIALVDEVEKAKFVNQRFTAAY